MPFNADLVDHRWGNGYIESLDQHVDPPSLYLAQLAVRQGVPVASSSTAFRGEKSEWNGFTRYDFEVDGKDVLVVAPDTPAAGRPWAWHGEFFGHKPGVDVALLGKGLHVVHRPHERAGHAGIVVEVAVKKPIIR